MLVNWKLMKSSYFLEHLSCLSTLISFDTVCLFVDDNLYVPFTRGGWTPEQEFTGCLLRIHTKLFAWIELSGIH